MWFKLAGADFSKNNLGTMSSISSSYLIDYTGLTGMSGSPSSVSYAGSSAGTSKSVSVVVTVTSGYTFKSGSTITASGGKTGTVFTADKDYTGGQTITFTMSVTANTKLTGAAEATGGSSSGGSGGTTTNYTFTINPTPTSATVTLSATGYSTVSGTGSKSITVANGTTVNWSVSASGYTTQSGTQSVTSTSSKSVTLSVTGATMDGYTQQSLDTSLFVNKGLTQAGLATSTNSQRLSYSQALKVPNSGRIIVTCPEGYYIGVRSGATATNLIENQYWYNSGDEIQIAGSGTSASDAYFMFCVAKMDPGFPTFSVHTPTEHSDSYEAVSTSIASNIALYYKDTYTGDIDTEALQFNLVETMSTDTADWRLQKVSEAGYVGSDGDDPTRLAWGTPMNSSDMLTENTIMVTCDPDYCWAMRVSSDGGATYTGNMYWYHSGTAVRLSTGTTRTPSTTTNYTFIINFGKPVTPGGISQITTGSQQTMTKDEITTIAPKIYTATPASK